MTHWFGWASYWRQVNWSLFYRFARHQLNFIWFWEVWLYWGQSVFLRWLVQLFQWGGTRWLCYLSTSAFFSKHTHWLWSLCVLNLSLQWASRSYSHLQSAATEKALAFLRLLSLPPILLPIYLPRSRIPCLAWFCYNLWNKDKLSKCEWRHQSYLDGVVNYPLSVIFTSSDYWNCNYLRHLITV